MLEGTAQGQNSIMPPRWHLPPELHAKQQELEQLWMQLEGHCQDFAALSGLVHRLAGCDVHPHAIDGAQLRQAGQLPGAPSTAGSASREHVRTCANNLCRAVLLSNSGGTSRSICSGGYTAVTTA